jgi:catechol 2,3-dioxygenase-like lactoylglutathione lyase family enzyme
MKSHFGFAKLVVKDLDGTAAFYREVAQLEELMRVEDEVGGRAIEEVLFKPTGEGGATFVLFKFLDRDVPASEEVIVGFQTPDVIAFVDRVRRGGGSVVIDVEEKAAHGVKVAFVKDPEGHLIEVVELL